MLKNILLVGAGGFVGSILRYLLSVKFNTVKFPYGTLCVNAIGCILIGILLGYFSKQPSLKLQLLLVTGFCGGFTTFSAFSAEIINMITEQKTLNALVYCFVTLLFSLVFTFLGYKLFHNIIP